MSTADPSSRWLAAAVALSAAAVGAALVSQHVLDMQPCPWCVLQRLIFVTIALCALLGLALAAQPARRLAAGLVAALALCGAAAALWQYFVAGASLSCNQTLADRIMDFTGLDRLWPAVFAAYASCGEARAALFGVPYEGYALVLFLVIATAAWRALRPRT